MFKRTLDIIVSAVAIAMVAYHLVYAQTYLQGIKEHEIFHLGFALVLLFLISIQKSRKGWPLKLAAVLLSAACFVFLRVSANSPAAEHCKKRTQPLAAPHDVWKQHPIDLAGLA